ncbi:RdgB/HAM1 family non-canonical purine NTP pyrophosphatase [Pseudohalocynthiibacter aestuariivivens]|uniref:dITP/XTP pyrophosphatase n=1 Tax=Pseudohalocynthiibacter aestuariivivens TaxID=1591409 RepID=A0ABV5JJZ6_9RHOB|nr:RdgB/HAM1 family non-canonical purine NTP pyrophosphatase [Pseudohalocynthiibacter aestuariivivens]MBS9717650.1 RdgB/HAM1 family non-canonical purine NTP pyrophosphatase [Pseudohalocynthiibacter aestuariivivens]
MRKLTEGKLVVATHNAGKLREISALLAPHGVDVVSAAALGFDEPEETEDTFAGNARIKAHFAAKKSGLPALSDDSGIMVDALDGAPGVYTADWAETPDGRDFPMAMSKVWSKLEDMGAKEPRSASFNCTLCLAWPDGHDELFEGKVDGRLVWPIRGSHGFGYDPMFLPNGESETFGEMSPEKKHGMSHRAAAFSELVDGCFD